MKFKCSSHFHCFSRWRKQKLMLTLHKPILPFVVKWMINSAPSWKVCKKKRKMTVECGCSSEMLMRLSHSVVNENSFMWHCYCVFHCADVRCLTWKFNTFYLPHLLIKKADADEGYSITFWNLVFSNTSKSMLLCGEIIKKCKNINQCLVGIF